MPPVDGPAQPDEPIPPVSLDKPATEPAPPAAEPAPPADPWAPPSAPPAGAVPPPPADAVPPHAGPAPYPPPYPYGSWSPAPTGPPQGYNGLAIAAMVTGLLGGFCFLWILGIVLGIIALRQVRARNEKGRGMAITGIVAGIVWVVAGAVLVVAAMSSAFRDGFDEGRATYRAAHTSVFDLTRGTCYDDGSAGGASVTTVKTVPCSDPHDGEVYARASLAVGAVRESFPGTAELTRRSDRACARQLFQYVMDAEGLPDTVRTSFFYPDRSTWSDSASHTAVCTLTTKDGPHSGSFQQDTSKLSSDQIVYLNAFHLLEAALYEKPDGTASAHPAEFRAWSQQVATGITGELEELNSRHWDGAAATAVSTMVTDLRADLVHWQAAARSTDTAVLASEVHQGLSYVSGNTNELRSVLGLPRITSDDSGDGPGASDPAEVV